MNILLLDNIDSFTYNLVDALRSLEHKVTVIRNYHPLPEILSWMEGNKPDLVMLSPGPGEPAEAGCMMELIGCIGGDIPIVGICLGHQALALANGGSIKRAKHIRHGKASRLELNGPHEIFADIDQPVQVARYHSLVVDTLPDEASVIATSEGEVMAFTIDSKRQVGIQFHPESILTTRGETILKNIIKWPTAMNHFSQLAHCEQKDFA